MSKDCYSILEILFHDFDTYNIEHVLLFEEMFTGLDEDKFIPVISPSDTESVDFKLRAYEFDLERGALFIEFDSTWPPPLKAYENCVKRDGLWSKLRFETCYIDNAMLKGGFADIEKDDYVGQVYDPLPPNFEAFQEACSHFGFFEFITGLDVYLY